jgi:hypothetical protein
MTYYADLSPCDYFGPREANLVAVGWLENGRPVPTGEVPEPVFDQLQELLREPWAPVAFPGWHDCVYRYGQSKLGSITGRRNAFVRETARSTWRPS